MPRFDPIALADRAGVFASAACGVHCVLTPLAAGAAAALPAGWIFSTQTEATVLAAVLAIGLASLIPAYRSRHGRKRCLILFSAGAALLILSRFVLHAGPLEPWLLGSGAVLASVAHWTNLKLCRSCRTCGCS